MFKNIQNSIKVVAHVTFWLGLVVSVNSAIALISETGLFWSGLLLSFGGTLVAWLVSIFIYGFGRLIENTQTIIEKMEHTRPDNHDYIPVSIPVSKTMSSTEGSSEDSSYDAQVTSDIVNAMLEGRLNTLREQKNKGIITEEEYLQKVKALLNS